MFMLCSPGKWGEFNFPQDWIAEVKYDGTRILAEKEKNRVKMTNRRGFEKSDVFPEITEELEKIPYDFILDGEIISSDFLSLAERDHLIDPFRIRILSKTNPCKYVVFDILKFQGEGLTSKPLEERKKVLEKFSGERIVVAERKAISELILLAEKREIEGFVVKDPKSRYEPKRSGAWIKFRKSETEDLPVLGYEESDKPERPIKSLICRYKGKEVRVSSGLDTEEMETIKKVFQLAPHYREGRKLYLRNPSIHAEVSFFKDPSGYRFPKLHRLRADK
jgi:ATP-dependent DNA ligase